MILILKYGLHLTTRMIFLKTAMVLLKQTRNGTRDQEKTMLRCIISLVLILDWFVCCTWHQWRFILLWLLQANVYWRTIQNSSGRITATISGKPKIREQNTANRCYCQWDVSFHRHNNFDGPWRSWYHWSTNELCYTPLYSSVMKPDKVLHVMRYLHFENNENPITGQVQITTGCGKS